ncbi:MAG: GNAT family N-acetyltransferase [Longimicrobiales bacterium]
MRATGGITLQRAVDMAGFLERAGAWLLASEAENNLMLGLAARLKVEPWAYAPPVYAAMLELDADVVGCIMRTPPHKLILSRMPLEALPLVVQDVQMMYGSLPGVLGPESVAFRFAELWSAATQKSVQHGRASRIYQLTRVIPPARPAPGELRVAEPADIDVIAEWIAAFGQEVNMPASRPRKMAEERVHRRELFLWVDGRPRCMAAWAGSTPNSVRIGYVYTPPAERGRGYASAITASASQRALDAGYRYCFLFTDLANPTSNAIYQALGYQPVSDVMDYLFVVED